MFSWNRHLLSNHILTATLVRLGLHRPRYVSVGIISFKPHHDHYDALGVSPKATHSDIKAAYYKLSMIYHPDKNKGSVTASDKFRDITSAYEVLGNFRLRKLYDKGILQNSGPQFEDQSPTSKEEDPTTKFYRSRMYRNRPPTASGRTPIYNFDEWSRAHYGASFARRQAANKKYQRDTINRVLNRSDMEKELFIIGVSLVIIAFVVLSMAKKENLDQVNNATSALSDSESDSDEDD